MQFGGPAAFYEIAATLIPVLLLGGVVLEAVKPPETDAAASEESGGIPATDVGVLVIMLEVVALDAVASGSTDWGHALIVGGGLIFGNVVCRLHGMGAMGKADSKRPGGWV
jgi:hypothetical protein